MPNSEITLVILDDFLCACQSKLVDNACCLMYEYVLSSIDILIDYRVWFYVLVSHKVVYNTRCKRKKNYEVINCGLGTKQAKGCLAK